MMVEILTKEDLQALRLQLVGDLKELLKAAPGYEKEKKWLKGKEVRQILNISANTLQSLRVSGKLRFSKVGGILYYKYEDLKKLLDRSEG